MTYPWVYLELEIETGHVLEGLSCRILKQCQFNSILKEIQHIYILVHGYIGSCIMYIFFFIRHIFIAGACILVQSQRNFFEPRDSGFSCRPFTSPSSFYSSLQHNSHNTLIPYL